MRKGKGNGVKLALTLFLISIFVIGIVFLYVIKVIWPVEPTNTRVVIELGDSIDRDISFYVQGQDWSVGKGTMDWSGLDENRVGEYVVTYTHGKDVFSYNIIVQDTIAPEVSLISEMLYYTPGSEIQISELVRSTFDLSGQVELNTDNPVIYGQEECGPQVITVIARDPSGNETRISKEVYIDTAPKISGAADCYVAVGKEYSYGQGLSAVDTVDGDLTDRIIVDTSAVNWRTAGEYNVEYRATDNYGLTGTAHSKVYVYDQAELDLLVANRIIDRWNNEILGASNLYCGGSADMESLQEQEQFMLPCAVHISELDAQELYGHLGSGYIIDMDEENVFIGSCHHVIKHANSNSYVYFYDSSRARFDVIGYDKDLDVGFIRVKTNDLPEETRNSIFSCQLDLTRFNECMLKEGEPLFFQVVDRNGYKYTREGVGKGLTTVFSVVKEPLLNITARSVAGNSGSGVFDELGNLVGMVEGYHVEGNRKTYVAIPADRIYDKYVEITGRDLFIK